MESIDIYEFEIRKNVASYGFKEGHHDAAWLTTHTTPLNESDDPTRYLCIDTHNDSFAHWVFECGIYLPLFKLLKEKYPNLKIWLRIQRSYKILFMDYFAINSSDIVYSAEEGHNICYFPKPIMWLNANRNKQWEQQVEAFVSFFSMDSKKEYKVCVLPRQSKENSKNCDRTYTVDNLIQGLDTNNISHTILETDKVSSLQTQIATIQKSEIVIVTDGSPYWVNGMFSTNAKIIILGHDCEKLWHHHDRCRYLHSQILNRDNEVYTVRYHRNTDTVISDSFTWADVESYIM